MNKRQFLVSFTAFILTTSCLSAANKYISSRIAYAKIPPKIDGTLKSAEWKSAAVLASFSNTIGRLSKKQGKVMVSYDRKCLYFGFRSVIDWEPNVTPLSFDNMGIWTVDSIDIAIIPDPTQPNNVMRFVFERGGGKADMRAIGQVKQPPGLWNPEWQVACRLLPHSYITAFTWQAEVAIPWTSLGIQCPKTGTKLPVQIIRCIGNIRRESGVNPDRVITWAPVIKGRDWINPGDFGLFYFEENKPVLQANPGPEFGISGKLTAPTNSELTGMVWEVGHSGNPIQRTKCSLGDKPFKWPKPIVVKKDTSCMMYWIIKDKAGIIGAGKYISTIKPPFQVSVGVAHALKQVTLVGNLSQLKIRKGSKIVSMLLNHKGKVVSRNKLILTSEAKHFEITLPFKGIPAESTGTVVVNLLDAYGKLLYNSKHTVKGVATPAWLGKSYGAVTAPLPGWEPIKILPDKSGIDVKILNNKYRFGTASPLPETIDIRGDVFSAGAMSFEAVTSSGRQLLKAVAPPEIIADDKRGITLNWKGESKDLTLSAKIRVEFDGLAWYETTLTPRYSKVKIQSLAITLPILPEKVRYMRACNAMNVREPANFTALVGNARTSKKLPSPNVQQMMEFSSAGWTFENCFNNFYWVGNENGGMFFVLPSRRNMKIKNKYTKVVDNPKEFTVSFYLIDHESEIKKPVHYDFGLILTPSKHIVNKTRLWRIGSGWPGLDKNGNVLNKINPDLFKGRNSRRFFHSPELPPFTKDYLTTVMLPCWKLRTPQNGNPTPSEPELKYIDKWLANTKKTIGGSPMLWYDALFSMYHLPQAVDFIFDWESYPITRLPVEQLGSYMCPTDAWIDYYLYGVANRMKQGVKSFYMDLTFFKPCSNRFHGCGYWDDSETLQGIIPFLKTREMFLRFQKMVKENDPDGLLVLHGSSASPLCIWMDAITDGEVWITAPNYSTLTPEYFQANFAVSEQLGVVSNFFPALILLHYQQALKSKIALSEVCGMTFSHGESMWNGTSAMLPGLRIVWDIIDQFGIAKAEWVPYWRNELSSYPDGIIVSSWQRQNRRLLVIFNPAYEPRILDLRKLKNCHMTDQITGKEWKNIQTTIEPRGFKLLLVENK